VRAVGQGELRLLRHDCLSILLPGTHPVANIIQSRSRIAGSFHSVPRSTSDLPGQWTTVRGSGRFLLESLILAQDERWRRA
jgi:hypothetical protein